MIIRTPVLLTVAPDRARGFDVRSESCRTRPGWRSRSHAVVVASLLACLSSPVASAATPVDLGLGAQPTVAVDAAGTAYIAFNDGAAAGQMVHFCKVPRGATTCAETATLTPPGSTVVPPYVFVDGTGTVRILVGRYGLSGGPFAQDLLYSSADGFASATSVGTVAPSGDAIAGPGNALSVVNANSGSIAYQAVPTDGTSSGAARADLTGTYQNQSDIGLVNASTPLVTFENSATTAFNVFNGAGPINDPTSWSATQVLATGVHGHLSGGPSGLFDLLAESGDHLVVRKYDTASKAFGTPTSIPGGTGNLVDSYLSQDAAGSLHALWESSSPTGTQLEYATSADGTTWTGPTGVLNDDVFAGLRAALAADHVGVAVWSTGTGTGSHVHTAVLAPPPPPPPPSPSPPVALRASFTYSPQAPCAGAAGAFAHRLGLDIGTPVTFNATDSQALSLNRIVSYNWFFGESAPDLYLDDHVWNDWWYDNNNTPVGYKTPYSDPKHVSMYDDPFHPTARDQTLISGATIVRHLYRFRPTYLQGNLNPNLLRPPVRVYLRGDRCRRKYGEHERADHVRQPEHHLRWAIRPHPVLGARRARDTSVPVPKHSRLLGGLVDRRGHGVLQEWPSKLRRHDPDKSADKTPRGPHPCDDGAVAQTTVPGSSGEEIQGPVPSHQVRPQATARTRPQGAQARRDDVRSGSRQNRAANCHADHQATLTAGLHPRPAVPGRIREAQPQQVRRRPKPLYPTPVHRTGEPAAHQRRSGPAEAQHLIWLSVCQVGVGDRVGLVAVGAGCSVGRGAGLGVGVASLSQAGSDGHRVTPVRALCGPRSSRPARSARGADLRSEVERRAEVVVE